MSLFNQQYLVETDWLEAHLEDPDLRVLDCSVKLAPDSGGSLSNSAKQNWAQSHIPGSVFVDLTTELSDLEHSLPLMLPTAQQFTQTLSRCGVEEGKRVILYDACEDKWPHIWAARVWWMLRVYGFDQAAILNGGWHKWNLEKRPISKKPSSYPKGNFRAKERPNLIANKQEVQDSLQKGNTCLINALTAEEYAGKKSRYGRPGRIPTSLNVPAPDLVNPQNKAYLPKKELHRMFEKTGALEKDRVITYCGGGIAASSAAFVLTLLGKSNVAVYDGSLFEWASDRGLPMEKG